MFNLNFFSSTNDEKPNALKIAIENLYSELAGHEAHTKEYAAAADQVVKLETLQKNNTTSWKPSPDALLAAGVSLVSVIAILHYEKLGVVTSKAIGFVTKMK